MRHMKRYAAGILLSIFFITGCKRQPFIIKDEGGSSVDLKMVETTGRAEKIFPEKPWIYEEQMEDPELREVLMYPIVNVQSAYAKTVNDFINARLAQLSSKNGDRKRSGEPMLAFRYSVYVHERFISLLTEIESADGGAPEKMSFNIDLTTGAEMKPDNVGGYLGFDGNIQEQMEEGIVSSYGDPSGFNEETRRFAGNSLENFWGLEYKGYTQYYVREDVLYLLYNVYDNSGAHQREIPIYPTKGGGNDSRNELAEVLQVPLSSDLAVAYLGKGTDEETVAQALRRGKELLSSAGYERTPTLLMRMDEGRGMRSEDYYLVIPRNRYTVLSLMPIDSSTKLPTSDLTERDYVWDSAYIVCVNTPDQPTNAQIEAVYRGWRKVFEPVLRPEDGSGALSDATLFDLTSQLKSGETSAGYPMLLDRILWVRNQNTSLE